MSLQIVIPPYAEPVSLAEMKGHLKIDASVIEDDGLISAQIIAARDAIETATGTNVCRCRTMLATTFDRILNCFPCGSIKLPRVPLISVTSITYVDTAGDTQTMDTDDYVVDLANGKIDLAYNAIWPTTLNQPNSVTVRFLAGMTASFTVDAAANTATFKGRSFSIGDRIRLLNSGGALPGGLQANTDYFIIAGNQVSLTSGGTAVDITGIGSGTHFAALDLAGFETLRAAIKLEVAKLYYNRGDSGVSGWENTQRAIDSLVAAVHA